MRCIHCGADGPAGPFCSTCGRRQVEAAEHARRTDRFAANPDEHVLAPSLLSTLFPHLDRRGLQTFFWLLVGGTALVLVMAMTGSVAGAVLAAAALLPTLFLLYLYETRAYGDSPLLVVGVTFMGGVLLGVIAAFLAERLEPAFSPVIASIGGAIVLWSQLIVAAAIVGVQELVKPVPAVVLRVKAEFRQPMDGFVLGVTAGLGFAFGSAAVRFAEAAGSIGAGPIAAWVPQLLTDALLRPASHGAATAIIALALWTDGNRRPWRTLAAAALGVTGRVLFEQGSQLASGLSDGPIVVLAWQALVAGALLLLARGRLHDALVGATAGRSTAAGSAPSATMCGSCGVALTGGAFCHNCGVSVAALPRPAAAPPSTAA